MVFVTVFVVVNGNVDWRKLIFLVGKIIIQWFNNDLIACRKVQFKTGKVKCHGKVILLIFLLLCCLFKPLIMAMIKWSQQGLTILNLRGIYNVRSTVVLGGYISTGQRSYF